VLELLNKTLLSSAASPAHAVFVCVMWTKHRCKSSCYGVLMMFLFLQVQVSIWIIMWLSSLLFSKFQIPKYETLFWRLITRLIWIMFWRPITHIMEWILSLDLEGVMFQVLTRYVLDMALWFSRSIKKLWGFGLIFWYKSWFFLRSYHEHGTTTKISPMILNCAIEFYELSGFCKVHQWSSARVC
jgi:hypothetical protein